MTVHEADAASGLSVDTIRFHEKAGKLPPVPRDARGWRNFPPPVLEWLTVLSRLRATGMPMAEMQRFARLEHDPATPQIVAERLAILHAHARRLAQRRTEIEAAQDYPDHKIAAYSEDRR
jgi:DNA-binding transcriptional MerR regulator